MYSPYFNPSQRETSTPRQLSFEFKLHVDSLLQIQLSQTSQSIQPFFQQPNKINQWAQYLPLSEIYILIFLAYNNPPRRVPPSLLLLPTTHSFFQSKLTHKAYSIVSNISHISLHIHCYIHDYHLPAVYFHSIPHIPHPLRLNPRLYSPIALTNHRSKSFTTSTIPFLYLLQYLLITSSGFGSTSPLPSLHIAWFPKPKNWNRISSHPKISISRFQQPMFHKLTSKLPFIHAFLEARSHLNSTSKNSHHSNQSNFIYCAPRTTHRQEQSDNHPPKSPRIRISDFSHSQNLGPIFSKAILRSVWYNSVRDQCSDEKSLCTSSVNGLNWLRITKKVEKEKGVK